jgi:hypothetical protein
LLAGAAIDGGTIGKEWFRLKEDEMRPMALILLSLSLVGIARADEDAVQKYRNYTPMQIERLDEKVRSSDVPIMYTLAAQKGLSAGSDVAFAMELNSLMYAGIHDYQSAVKAFQTDLGDAASGVLTVWQIHQLEQRFEMQKLSRVLFPENFWSFKEAEYATVEGTMMIIDDRIAWPINHVKVRCYKAEDYCRLDEVDLAVPNHKSWSQNYQVMVASPEYYKISRWGQDSIDAVPRETDSGCRTTSMNLNFKTQEFYYITRNGGGGTCEFMGNTLERLEKPRIAQIVKGAEIIGKEFARVQKAAFEVLSSDFRRKVDKFLESQKDEPKTAH